MRRVAVAGLVVFFLRSRNAWVLWADWSRVLAWERNEVATETSKGWREGMTTG